MPIVMVSAVATRLIAAAVNIEDEMEILWPRLDVSKHVVRMLTKYGITKEATFLASEGVLSS
jgi:hypothetical protein